MNASNWGDLQLLWLLLLVPVVIVAYAFDGQRRRRVLERIGHLPMIRRMTASSSPARRRWKAVLTVGALALLITTLARPQVQGKGKLTENRGLDMVVALDFSKSMLAKDVYPSRLDRAKLELGNLIDNLKGDRVGLVAFAGETLSYPLTVDYEAAQLFWKDLGPGDMPVGGTDLGRAVDAARELLSSARQAEIRRRPDAKRRPSQVILLLTDGEDTEGRGLTAARAAAKEGIKIYTLGIGTREAPFIQTYDEDGRPAGTLADESGAPVRAGLDEGTLKQMAQLSGGEYFALNPARFGVERVQKDIQDLERTEEEARFEREPDDVGRFLLLPGFLLLVLSALVRERKVPRPVAEREATAAPKAAPQRQLAAAAILILCFPFTTGFDLLMRRDPNVEEGNRLLQQGKAEDALKAYDKAATALPEEPIVRYDRGQALYALGRYAEAQKEFQRAAEAHDGALKADAWYNMGNALYKQERFKESLDAYKHVLGLRPDDRRAKWNLELALRKLQEQKQQQQQQKQQAQNQQNQQNKDQNQQNNQQQQPQKDDQKQQQNAQNQQNKDQQQDQQQQQQEAQQQQQQQQEQQQQQAKRDEEKKGGPAGGAKPQPAPLRDIDKQDAEAVLDALERVEPTVQKDLARRRAGNRRPTKDW